MKNDPTRKELARILRDGTREIQRLRRENELLSAQMRVVDIFDRALQRSQGYAHSEDVGYMLERLTEHFEKPEAEVDANT